MVNLFRMLRDQRPRHELRRRLSCRGVTVENREAGTRHHSARRAQALIYADPPYVPSTRSSLKDKNGNRGHYYRCDMEEPAHVRLAELLHEAKGMVAVSGYWRWPRRSCIPIGNG